MGADSLPSARVHTRDDPTPRSRLVTRVVAAGPVIKTCHPRHHYDALDGIWARTGNERCWRLFSEQVSTPRGVQKTELPTLSGSGSSEREGLGGEGGGGDIIQTHNNSI